MIRERLEALLRPNAEGIMPCPNQWCGGIDIELHEDATGDRSIICAECGCSAHDRSEATALQDWNRRPLIRLTLRLIEQRDTCNGWHMDEDRMNAELLKILDGES